MKKTSQKNEHRKNEAGQVSVLIARFAGAAVLIIAALLFNSIRVLPTVLLIVSFILSGYDVILAMVERVEAKKFLAEEVLISIVGILSFILGFGIEGAAMMLLYQVGKLVVSFLLAKSKETAQEYMRYQSSETMESVRYILDDADRTHIALEAEIRSSADFVLKIMMGFAVLFAILVPLFTSYSYTDSIHRALMIIVLCTPTSLVVAMPAVCIFGISYCAGQGIIIKNSRTFEKLSASELAVIDEVGIFTEECPQVLSAESDVIDSKTLMNFVAHAVYYSEQPFAKAIASINDQEYKLDVISEFEDFPGLGVKLKIGGMRVLFGTKDLLSQHGITVPEEKNSRGIPYYLYVSEKYAGKLYFSRTINEDSMKLCSALKENGIKQCILLSEDAEETTESFAADAGFDDFRSVADTETKLQTIQELHDSANAPLTFIYTTGIQSHSSADIDVRVFGKSKYADIIVFPEFISYLPDAISIAGRVKEVCTNSALFVFLVKALLIFLSINGICNLWFAVFADCAAVLASILFADRVTKDSLRRTIDYKRGK